LPRYEQPSKEIIDLISQNKPSAYAFDNALATRRSNNPHDAHTPWRPAFVRDIDKIMHCPYYNRYADKTQVFSFYKNDDITRRFLHVQLVSRIARTIGSALGLNTDLIEAIALGHDIGHTPFGHAGETFLDNILHNCTGMHFSHNIHSVRVLDTIFPYNITLQTLSGIASHDGELEQDNYSPKPISFEEFDALIASCYRDKAQVKKLVPSTLEGCVMRISDIIAYLGKDRQDASRAGLVAHDAYSETDTGVINAEIINNLMVNVIQNSYGKNCITMDASHFEDLKKIKSENYSFIYKDPRVEQTLQSVIRPMMEQTFKKLLDHLVSHNQASPIFTHHISLVEGVHYKRATPYRDQPPELIVADYIASMTDDYFIDLHAHLFPSSPYKVTYVGYFD